MKNYRRNYKLSIFKTLSYLALAATFTAQSLWAGNPSEESLNLGEQAYRVSPGIEYIYSRPGKFDFIKNAPSGFKAHVGSYFKRENLPIMAAIALSTAIILPNDQKLYKNAREFGRDVGIQDSEYLHNLSPVPELAVLVPSDLGGSLYFIGDGLPQLVVDASFLTYGLIKKDNRALQTASQIMEGLAITGSWVQVLKRTCGRETPDRMTQHGGKWQFFPNLIDTFENVPNYDSFPSGHVATVMTTMTVIRGNYPNTRFLAPLQWTLVSLLAYQMVNNGVHWTSDYPIALWIGHDVGKRVVARGHRERAVDGTAALQAPQKWYDKIAISPVVFRDRSVGMQAGLVF